VWFQNKRAKEKRIKKERPFWGEFCDLNPRLQVHEQSLLLTPGITTTVSKDGGKNRKPENFLRKRCCFSPVFDQSTNPITIQNNRQVTKSPISLPDISLFGPAITTRLVERPLSSSTTNFYQHTSTRLKEASSQLSHFHHPLEDYSINSTISGLPAITSFQPANPYLLPPFSDTSSESTELVPSISDNGMTTNFSNNNDAPSEQGSLSTFSPSLWCKDFVYPF